MSILEKIRNKSGLAIVFVGGALALFVISDALQSNSRMFGSSQSTDVGVINGEKISYAAYDAEVNGNLDATRQQMGPDAKIDQNTIDMVREQTWNQIVMESLMKDEYSELGIKVTSEEMFDLMQGDHPHQQILSAPIFKNQQGEFDRGLVIRFLKDMEKRPEADKKQWLTFEEGIYKEALTKKYYALIRKGVYATTLEARQAYTNRSKTIDADIVALNYFTVADSAVKVEDSDLKSFMNKNIKKYAERENSRKIEFVLFNAVASSEDTAATMNWVSEQMVQFPASKNDTLYVAANSEEAFDPTPKPRSAYPEEVADRLFRDSVGSVIGPVYKDGKWSIYKVVGIKQDTVYQMRASHILFKTENGDTAATLKKANEVMAQIRNGADFGAMAAQYGTDGTAQRGGDLGWFSEGSMVKEFNDAVLAGKKGDIRIVRTQFGIHILKITEDKSKKLVTAGVLAKTLKPSDATVTTASNAAGQFASTSTDLESFGKNVTEMKLSKRTADVREGDRQVGGVQEARDVVRWAYNAKKGDISEVFAVGDQFMVAVLSGIREKDKADFETVKQRVETDYRKEKKAEMLLEKAAEAVKGATSIHDVAGKLQLAVTPIAGQTFENNNIAYVGPDNTMVGTLFGSVKAVNKLSAPVKGDNAVYVYVISKVNEAPADADVSSYKGEVQAQLAQRVEYGTFDALKDLKKVEDYRYRFN